IRCSLNVWRPRTIVCPALLPPWKRTTASARSASRSVTFPFPSSPHWAPTNTIPGIGDGVYARHGRTLAGIGATSGVPSPPAPGPDPSPPTPGPGTPVPGPDPAPPGPDPTPPAPTPDPSPLPPRPGPQI